MASGLAAFAEIIPSRDDASDGRDFICPGAWNDTEDEQDQSTDRGGRMGEGRGGGIQYPELPAIHPPAFLTSQSLTPLRQPEMRALSDQLGRMMRRKAPEKEESRSEPRQVSRLPLGSTEDWRRESAAREQTDQEEEGAARAGMTGFGHGDDRSEIAEIKQEEVDWEFTPPPSPLHGKIRPAEEPRIEQDFRLECMRPLPSIEVLLDEATTVLTGSNTLGTNADMRQGLLASTSQSSQDTAAFSMEEEGLGVRPVLRVRASSAASASQGCRSNAASNHSKSKSVDRVQTDTLVTNTISWMVDKPLRPTGPSPLGKPVVSHDSGYAEGGEGQNAEAAANGCRAESKNETKSTGKNSYTSEGLDSRREAHATSGGGYVSLMDVNESAGKTSQFLTPQPDRLAAESSASDGRPPVQHPVTDPLLVTGAAQTREGGTEVMPTRDLNRREGVRRTTKVKAADQVTSPRPPTIKDPPVVVEQGKIDRSILKLIGKNINPDLDPGYVYCLKCDELPGLVKIGYSKDLDDRQGQILSTCGLKTYTSGEYENISRKVRFPLRVEKLAQKELRGYQKIVTCGKFGISCRDEKHKEWFCVTEEEALRVVERWRKWFEEYEPYHTGTGQLKARWLAKLERRQFAAWVPLQIWLNYTKSELCLSTLGHLVVVTRDYWRPYLFGPSSKKRIVSGAKKDKEMIKRLESMEKKGEVQDRLSRCLFTEGVALFAFAWINYGRTFALCLLGQFLLPFFMALCIAAYDYLN